MKAITRRVNNFLADRVAATWEKIEPRVRARQRERLAQRFGSCGKSLQVYQPLVIESPENVKVGDDVAIGSFVHMWGDGGVTIGNRVMIAAHACIGSSTHDPTAPVMRTTLLKYPVVIDDDVWIGYAAIVLPGVTIGKNSIVGAGAVVTKDVPPFSVAVGNPARVIRAREIKGEAT